MAIDFRRIGGAIDEVRESRKAEADKQQAFLERLVQLSMTNRASGGGYDG